MNIEKLTVPNIGDFTDVEVIEVLIKPGNNIKKNQTLITIESDKSSVEIPSNFNGKIMSVNVKIGDKVSEGHTIGSLEVLGIEEKLNISEEKNKLPKVLKEEKKDLEKKEIYLKSKNYGSKIFTTPKVRRYARELGAEISMINGSERKGRIVQDDVKNFIKEKLNKENFLDKNIIKKKSQIDVQEFNHKDFGEIETKDIPRVKRIAAPHLTKSWNEIPHVTQHDEVDITEIDEFRKSLRDTYTGEKIKITPLVFLMRAVVKALKIFPSFNSSININNNKITLKKYFHIGIAVDTPHGLMVPKIRNVDKKNLTEIGKELKKVSEDCRNLKTNKKEFYGGSMTISSLGSIGGSFFTPIINYPEVAILGVGKAEAKQVFKNDKFQKRIILPLSLSYDHRIIDGVEAVKFCNHLKESLGKDFAYKLAV
jgi:pyruvate dehydrogenase E2 component (dihydrolipoamide acetyltransferase)|tara:strand:- start:11289 stop:12560 length:1272 start_codon:yes stop_codon:yes gene_type:complete